MKIKNASLIIVIVGVILLLVPSISLTAIASDNFVLSESPNTSSKNQTAAFTDNIAPVNGNDSEGLGYDTKHMTHRSATEEWQPHLGQTNSFVEWWYFTALVHDAAGNKYMLFDTIFKYDSKDSPVVASQPDIAAMMEPEQSFIMSQVELSNYNEDFHFDEVDGTIS